MVHAQANLSRRDRERRSRRNEMLLAAQEVFAEKGYANATLDDIASRAEFGKGTIYNYFPKGKQEILLSIFALLHEHLSTLITNTFSPDSVDSFQIQLRNFFESVFDFFYEKLDLFVILIREAHRLSVSDDEQPQAFFIAQRERTLAALSEPIQRAMDRGEIRPMSPRFLAHMIMVNINGCQMKSCKMYSESPKESPKSASEMADFLTRLICDGISANAETK